MPRYFIRLAYRGAPFHGWQRQPNASSVQQHLEEGLATLLRAPVAVTGAGRTDTGVNARTMYAHFDLEEPLRLPEDALLRSLNKLVGPDIAVYSIFRVRSDAHARFDALCRTYRYFAVEEKSPFLYPLAWQAPPSLDYAAMNEAARLLLDTSDFTSFSKLHTDVKTNICRVTEAQWSDAAPGVKVFTITADRFLRNMVRAVVGTLVEVGRGKMDIEGFRRVIESRDRCAAGTSMPGHALYLWEVAYDWQSILL